MKALATVAAMIAGHALFAKHIARTRAMFVEARERK
jgi:hypothetical protein